MDRFDRRALTAAALAGALLGVILSALSTHDFAQHLDRQVHAIHCGIGAGKPGVDSGCKVAMLSPYSSVLRGTFWGGIPISLPAMAVFAFLLFYGIEITITGRDRSKNATALYLGAASVPVVASLIMGSIAAFSLGAACTVCIGIYLASALCFAGALGLWLKARRETMLSHKVDVALAPTVSLRGYSRGERRYFALVAGVAVLFVALPVLAYVAAVPDQSRFAAGCGPLETTRDQQAVLVPFSAGRPGARQAIEVLDPLCPACAAFEQRLERRALLFPLESSCNWMVERTLHPGACTVSEAVLCAGDRAGGVIAWAFANQKQILEAAGKDPGAARRMVLAAFPDLASCVGSPQARARLNRSLRWAVKNHLPVLTPQLYVDGVKVCDEDLDLGLEYTLGRMLARPVKP